MSLCKMLKCKTPKYEDCDMSIIKSDPRKYILGCQLYADIIGFNETDRIKQKDEIIVQNKRAVAQTNRLPFDTFRANGGVLKPYDFSVHAELVEA